MTPSTRPDAPVYIVSKGRWTSNITSRYLDAMDVPHFIVVEAAERDAYAATVPPSATLLVLDPKFQEEYETCDDLGDSKGKGPGPARNFAWEHALQAGADWHWVMDDNILGFFRLNDNLKVPVADGMIFRCMEEFADRYENLAMCGPNYFMFASRKNKKSPYVRNTRIYSCNLIRNSLPYRWRARYNEDTDLSLRMLKDGWTTVLFQAFLQNKITTQYMRGGNTDEFYIPEGTLPKSRMLVDLHPDVARLAFRYNRWHHEVDYSPFVQRLRRREGLELGEGFDNHGMVLRQLKGKRGRLRPAPPPRLEVQR